MKRVYRQIFFILAASLSLVIGGCGGHANYSPAQDELDVTIDALIAQPDSFVGRLIAFSGTCTGLSTENAHMIYVTDPVSNSVMRCTATEAIGGHFPQDIRGHKVRVRGLLQEQRIDNAFLDRIEHQFAARARELNISDSAPKDKASHVGTIHHHLEGGHDTDAPQLSMLEQQRAIIAENAKNGRPYISVLHLSVTGFDIIN